MLATGVIDPVNRNFDIAGVEETNTSISTINSQLKLSYTSEDGKLVQLVKPLTLGADNIAIGVGLGISPASEGGLKGYAQTTTSNSIAKSLTNVTWTNITNVQTKTFIDDNGITRVAVLLPVTLN